MTTFDLFADPAISIPLSAIAQLCHDAEAGSILQDALDNNQPVDEATFKEFDGGYALLRQYAQRYGFAGQLTQ